MRLLVRNDPRTPAAARQPKAPQKPLGELRREWIEALFDSHLPRGLERRENAIAALASDGEVWRLLHQARHSMAETTATIERLAARAAGETGGLRAA